MAASRLSRQKMPRVIRRDFLTTFAGALLAIGAPRIGLARSAVGVWTVVLGDCALVVWFFFFSSRRRHTSSYGDWSSDVCSSDLGTPAGTGRGGSRTGRSIPGC